MTWTQWLIFLLSIQLVHGVGTWKMYRSAGFKAWQAFVPIYNGVILMKIINRPSWWIAVLIFPIINLIMLGVIWVDTARSFGKNSYSDTALALLSLGFYNYYLNYFTTLKYIENRSIVPKSSSGEWVSSILFAVVVATFVHTYFFQPYVIPSSSLEKSLLVGDFLIVSKMHYGSRVPMTTVGFPMVHDTIPILRQKSYLFNDRFDEKNTSWINKFQLPYLRLPGWDRIERNEIVVFNQPADTLLDMNDFTPDRNYYKPIDKKTNLVKRCVGIPGDTLEIKEGYVYINGKQNELPDRAKLQFNYEVIFKPGKTFNQSILGLLKTRYDITDGLFMQGNKLIVSAASQDAVNKLKNHPSVAQLKRLVRNEGIQNPEMFPQDPAFNWNRDYFGPLYIPKAGDSMKITTRNLPVYKRLLTEYEGNTLEIKGNQIYINNELTTNYTFKQDYFWMMGDNRHNSIDARRWGFVPYDHVVGKPVFIWMSWNTNGKGFNKIRWDRVFSTVHSDGKRTSYLIPFLILLAGWYGFKKWRKKRAS
jgi:signal peptidase I